MSAGAAWIIYDLSKTVTSLLGQASRHERLFTQVGIKLGELKKESPVALAAEVAALSEAVARLKATQQRFQGRFDQYMGQERAEALDGNDDGPDDPKWRALMQLQQRNGRP